MADEYEYPYVGELRIFSSPVVPKGWARCDGQTLQIQENQVLFSLIGTIYGGNGQTTFCLPDLRGRVPISNGDVFTLGEPGGEEGHTLTQAEMAHHQHMLQGNNAVPAGNVPSSSTRLSNNQPGNLYGAPNNVVAMKDESIGVTGGSMPHENRQPYLVLNVCICIAGQFPTRPQEAGA
jgi:microcystin-dependent protein